MKFHNGTGCHIILVGILTETPSIKMNARGDLVAMMNIHIKTRDEQKTNLYDVVVFGEAALRMKRYGFSGLRLWVEGDLYTSQEKCTYIIAEKIMFLSDLEPNTSEVRNDLHAGYFLKVASPNSSEKIIFNLH